MFIRNLERLHTNLPNYMTLEGKDGFWYLVHRNYYDAALILTDRYGKRYDTYAQEIGGNQSLPAIKEFYDTVPEPLNILAPFLGLIDDNRAVELTGNVDAQVGAICIIGMQIALRKFLNVKKEIRQSAVFTMSIDSEYTKARDQFVASCITNTTNISVTNNTIQNTAVTSNSTNYTSDATSSYVDVKDDDEEPFDFPPLASESILNSETTSSYEDSPPTVNSVSTNFKHESVLNYINGGV